MASVKILILTVVSSVYFANAATITVTATTGGSYSSLVGVGAPGHNAGGNYIAGWFPMTATPWEYRNYFVFDLTAITSTILDARLDLLKPFFDLSPNPTDVFTVFDVSTDISTLISSPGSVSIFSDLGTGIAYGSTDYVPSAADVIISVNLNEPALLAMNRALGSRFAVGGAVQNLVGGNVWQTIFGGSFRPADISITVTTAAVPEPLSFILVAIPLATLLVTPRLRTNVHANSIKIQKSDVRPSGPPKLM